jgi:aminoglycoside phosphotransferase (APT) family kinase protein
MVNRGISRDEHDIFFTGQETELRFAHNDLQRSNIIVNADKIVGIIDWEMSGWFGDRAATVHRRMRCPGKESFVNANVSEDEAEDLAFWGSLF